jgi:expansin (peptidoglycan-binding protein)
MSRNGISTTIVAFGLCLIACSDDASGEEGGDSALATGSSGEAETQGSGSGGEGGDSGTGDGDSGGDGDATSGVGDSGGDGDATTGDGDSGGDGDATSGDADTGGDGDGTTGGGDVGGGLASATHYTGIDNGRCGFQNIPSGSSPHERIAALPTWLFGGAQWCGAADTFASCGGVTNTTLKVMVSDECPADTNQEHCYDGAWHFDLSQPAFSDMADLSCGVLGDVSWQVVEGTHAGNVKVRNKDGINQWWYSLYVLDHNYAITQVEMRPNAGEWVDATRSDTNFWTIESGSGITLPIDVRITDIHGQVITGAGVVTDFNDNSEFDVGAQFPGGMGGGGTLGGP